MKQLIKEIRSNLENKNYLSALALTLILPDICGKISFPELKGGKNVGKRYKCWYNEYIYPYELSPFEKDSHNEWVPDGIAIYKLRCNFLHDGSIDIDNDVKAQKEFEGYSDYKFILTNKVTSYNLSWRDGDKNKEPSITVRIGVEDFCNKICAVVENVYYSNHQDKDIYNDIVLFDFD